jgi:hypothetical protein
MTRKHCRALLSIAALGWLALAPAHAQDTKNAPQVVFLPPSSHPPMPAGLQLACISQSGSGAPTSNTCPVVKYQGITTWAYSYSDNRVSFALVSYDAGNSIVRNVEKRGARYIFDALSSLPNQTVMFVGQAQQSVTVPWSELGAVQK